MRQRVRGFWVIVFISLFFFGASTWMESTAWARAGGGGSSGSRGSRSFSSPSMPSSRPSPSSPSPSSPGLRTPGTSQPSTGGMFSRSPFMQGLAGGLAGGFLGSMLFGGHGYAGGASTGGGGGIGLMDIIIIGLLVYFAMKFFRRRRAQALDGGVYTDSAYQRGDESYGASTYSDYNASREYDAAAEEVERGLASIRSTDPSFNVEAFKELVQDLFFRIQAGWMNRSIDGIMDLLSPEMLGFFAGEFENMKQKGIINRLENIAIRKVEPSEAWQETGKDFITVFFTANLLDYSVDDKSGQVVSGDRLNPVKFQEFWTFCRDIGSPEWQLAAINQVEEPSTRLH